MDDKDLNKNFTPLTINPIFHCFETGSPFEKCSKCNSHLDTTLQPYIIHKDWGPNDLSSEFALCFSCIEDLRESTSKESRQKIESFIQSSGGLEKHKEILESGSKNDAGSDSREIDHCILCTRDIERPGAPHSLTCSVIHTGPFAIPQAIATCGACEEQLMELLSKETKDSWDGFYESIIDSPPVDMVDLPGPKKPCVVF